MCDQFFGMHENNFFEGFFEGFSEGFVEGFFEGFFEGLSEDLIEKNLVTIFIPQTWIPRLRYQEFQLIHRILRQY